MLCDLDEDGWIDDVDPTPEEFDENGFGPHQSLPVGDNTNYYYWVDLVVDQAVFTVEIMAADSRFSLIQVVASIAYQET